MFPFMYIHLLNPLEMLQPHYKPLVLFIFSLLLINIENLELIKTRKKYNFEDGSNKSIIVNDRGKKEKKKVTFPCTFLCQNPPYIWMCQVGWSSLLLQPTCAYIESYGPHSIFSSSVSTDGCHKSYTLIRGKLGKHPQGARWPQLWTYLCVSNISTFILTPIFTTNLRLNLPKRSLLHLNSIILFTLSDHAMTYCWYFLKVYYIGWHIIFV